MKQFFYKNDPNCPVKAAGVIFTKKGMKFNSILMQEITNKNYIQDFGGKVDEEDLNILETASRELFEESNASIHYRNTKKFLSINQLKRLISNNKYYILYIRQSKYLLFFVDFPRTTKVNFNVSGKYEILDMIPRTVRWMSMDEFFDNQKQKKLHARLDNKYVLNILGKLL